VELSRLGTLDTAEVWAKVLGAFAVARRVDRALLVEAEHVLAGETGLLANASAEALADIIAACDQLMAPCPSSLLLTAAARVVILLNADTADVPHELGVTKIALLAGAFARVGLREEGILSLVHQILRSKESVPNDADLPGASALGHRSIAELSFFCHVFDVFRERPDWVGLWLVPHAITAARICSLGKLTKILPLLSAVSHGSAAINVAAAEAIRHVVDVRLPILLTTDGGTSSHTVSVRTADEPEEEISADAAASLLLEALAVAHERDLGLILGLAARCIRYAPHLGLSEILKVANALAKLQVRHELLLIELADVLCVRHQRALSTEDVMVALRAWLTLQVPHAGLAEAARNCFSSDASINSDAPEEQLLADFVSLKVPGQDDQ